MNDIITQNLLTFILGGGLLSFITAVIHLKYTKKQAEAKALSSVQDVYQELIADLRARQRSYEERENRKRNKVGYPYRKARKQSNRSG